MSLSLMWVMKVLLLEGVEGALLREDLAIARANEVGRVTILEGAAAAGTKRVAVRHPEDTAQEVTLGIAMTSTSSSPMMMMESLGVVSLKPDGEALVVVEGPQMEGPRHGCFAMAFFDYPSSRVALF